MLFTDAFLQLKEAKELTEEEQKKTQAILEKIYHNHPSITLLTETNEEECRSQFQALLDYIIHLNVINYQIFAVYLANILQNMTEKTSFHLKELHYIQAKLVLEKSLHFLIEKADEVDPKTLNTYVVNECLPGAFTNLLDILFEIQDNIFTQIKTTIIRQLAICYAKHNFTYLAGDETHYVTPLMNFIAEDYGVLKRTDPLAKVLSTEHLQTFKIFLQQEFTVFKLLNTLAEQVFPDKISSTDKDHQQLLTHLEKKVNQLGLDYQQVLESAYHHTANEDFTVISYESHKEHQHIKIALLIWLFCQKDYVKRVGFFLTSSNDAYIDCDTAYVRYNLIDKRFTHLSTNECFSLLNKFKGAHSLSYLLPPLIDSLFALSPLSEQDMVAFLALLKLLPFNQHTHLFSSLLQLKHEQNAIALCQAYPFLLTEVLDDKNHYYALHFAAYYGNLEVLQYIINARMVSDTEMSEALYVAASDGHIHIINYLLPCRRENAFFLNDNGYTLLHTAAHFGRLELLAVLLTYQPGLINHATHAEENTPLHLAAARGHLDIVKLLCEKGADLSAVTRKGLTPFLIAAKHQHLKIISYFLDQHKLDVNQQNALSDAHALYYACKKNNLVMVDFLLQRGADPHVRHNRELPILTAMRNRNEAIVIKLLEKMTTNEALTNTLIETIKLFILYNWESAMEWLFKNQKINVNAFIHLAHQETQNILQYTISHGQAPMIRLLIKYNVDLGGMISANNIPYALSLALIEAKPTIYNLLYFYWAEKVKEVFINLSIYAFHFADKNDQENITKILSYFPPLEKICDQTKNTYLHYLVLRNEPVLLSACLKHRPQTNFAQQNIEQKTAIDLALQKKYYEIVLVLLAQGHPLTFNQLNQKNRRILAARAISQQHPRQDLLISYLGFNEPLNFRNDTALDLALAEDNLAAVKFIVIHSLCSINTNTIGQITESNKAIQWLQQYRESSFRMPQAFFSEDKQKRKSEEQTAEETAKFARR